MPALILTPPRPPRLTTKTGLSLLGIYTQVAWLLSLFDKKISDYPFFVHMIPFLYYVLYSFLLRHALLDLTQAHGNDTKKEKVEYAFIAVSIAFSLVSYYLEAR